MRASLDRVRANVLDWEHLPWLHPETFSHVRLLDRRQDGFRVESGALRALVRSTFSSTRCCGTGTRR